MNISKEHHPPLAFVAGVIVAVVAGAIMLPSLSPAADDHDHASHDHGGASEVHVHSDFLVVLDGEQVDLSGDRYMSAANQILHPDMHLHDNNDEVIHRHAENISLGDFFGSLGFELTNECITTPNGEEFCSNSKKQLALFVNGERVDALASYVNQEEDQILLYYGGIDTDALSDLQGQITNDSCIYSNTCPERGTAPPESCGLTCEL